MGSCTSKDLPKLRQARNYVHPRGRGDLCTLEIKPGQLRPGALSRLKLLGLETITF